MSTSGKKTRFQPLDNQAGGILLAALAILLVAGTVSAGVAHLVSSSSEGSVNSLESEKALYIAESARLMLQSGATDCDGLDIDGSACTANGNCAEELVEITGAWGNATHAICVPEKPFSSSDCTDPGDVDWNDPPGCIAGGNHWGPGDTPPGQVKDAELIVIDGDIQFQSAGNYDLDGQVCIAGELSASIGQGQGQGGGTASVTLHNEDNDGETINHCIGSIGNSLELTVNGSTYDSSNFDDEDTGIFASHNNITQCTSLTSGNIPCPLPSSGDWHYLVD